MTTRRCLISQSVAAAVIAGGFSSVVRADTPLFTLDLRVHGTGAKDAIVSEPGESVVLDLFIRANGQDANPNNDGMNTLVSNFMSSNGGLIGDLLGLPPPAPFNAIASSSGKQHDLDGDGDLDVGTLDPASQDFYGSRSNASTIFNQPANGFFIASVIFTASALNAETTQVRYVPRQNVTAGSPALIGTVDGVGYVFGGLDPQISIGSPVTIHASSVIDGGTPEFLSGTISTHLTLDHTIRQGAGSPLILAGGISAQAAGLLDTRDSNGNFSGQEIRVDDGTSGNAGGAIFIDKMKIGDSAAGTFTHSRGLTRIGSALTVGTAAPGTLTVSGGTFRTGTLKLGNGANGDVRQSGGYLTVDTLDMRGTAGTSSTAEITSGEFTANTGTIGGNGTVLLHVNGGVINLNGVSTNRTYFEAGASGATELRISSGTANLGDSFVRPGVAINQTGGLVNMSSTVIGASGGSTPREATYALTGGTFDPGGIEIQHGLLRQSGGLIDSDGIIHVYDRYELQDGRAKLFGLIVSTFPGSGGTTTGLVLQSGGSLSTDYLALHGGIYRITGGTFEVNRQLIIDQGGTIDFGNGRGALAAGQNSMIEIPAQGLANTSSARLVGKPGSLINYQPGQDPHDQFGTVETTGLLHEQGTPLHIPAGKSVTGAGNIIGNTTNDGELHPGYVGGRLDITGSYAQSPDAKLIVEFAGGDFHSRDFLAISGAATLDGMLDIDLIDTFRPNESDVFAILSASSLTGRFSNANSQVFFEGGRFDVSYTSTSVILRNFAAVPEPASATVIFGGLILVGSRRRKR